MKISNAKFWILASLPFFILPSLVYMGLVTDFQYDLFHPAWLWQAYNQYALAIMDGRLDVPLEAIGYEGMLFNGKVYMYYGILPAVIRILISPFVDLETTSVSRLLIWFFLTTGVSITQWVVLEYFQRNSPSIRNYFLLVITSITLWFGSAHFTLVQNGSLYIEPYAFSLFLVSAYLALFARNVIFRNEVKLPLKSFALISGLALFARPNIAIFLYLATVSLLAYQFIENKDVKKSLIPLGILLIAGSLLLTINYLRFDNPFSLSAGYYAQSLIEDNRERICGYEQSGQFNLLRLLPQFLFYMNGDYGVYRDISDWLGLGFVRTEHPHAIIVQMWAIPFIALLYMIYSGGTCVSVSSDRQKLIAGLLLISLASTIAILSYVTVTIRYIADIWMPFGLALLWGHHHLSVNSEKFAAWVGNSVWFKYSFVAALLILSYFPIQFANAEE